MKYNGPTMVCCDWPGQPIANKIANLAVDLGMRQSGERTICYGDIIQIRKSGNCGSGYDSVGYTQISAEQMLSLLEVYTELNKPKVTIGDFDVTFHDDYIMVGCTKVDYATIEVIYKETIGKK